MQYAYCSNKQCSYYQLYGTESRNHLRGGSTPRTISPEKFCGKCGAPMVVECPSCKAPRKSMDNAFCPDCGKPYK